MTSERPAIARRNLEALGRFQRLRTLDDGKSGHTAVSGNMNDGVFLVKRRTDGLICVQKRVPATSKDLLNEIRILQRLYHPNVCRYIDGFISEEDPPPLRASLYMEYCDLGSMETLLEKYRKRRRSTRIQEYMPEGFIWKAFLELSSALRYIHHGIKAGDPPIPKPTYEWPRVLHRDIKPANIFLRSGLYSVYPTVVLGDFGCATMYGMRGWNGSARLVGTSSWQPPEVPEHTTRGDVWAVGAVIQAMCRLDHGPVKSPPPGVDQEIWWFSPEARRPRRAGSYYSGQLNGALASALTFEKEERPFSYELYRVLKLMLRRARREWGLVDLPLPTWAINQRQEHPVAAMLVQKSMSRQFEISNILKR
ncbi:hypothetical protein MMC16_006589 [Acarospora aff. strigata]|nr:hypothetical protein [Acarospora aff. strigata]